MPLPIMLGRPRMTHRCLVCGSRMIDACGKCADREAGRVRASAFPDPYERAISEIERLTAELERARAERACGCADAVQDMHDRWGSLPAHQLAAHKIITRLRQMEKP